MSLKSSRTAELLRDVCDQNEYILILRTDVILKLPENLQKINYIMIFGYRDYVYICIQIVRPPRQSCVFDCHVISYVSNFKWWLCILYINNGSFSITCDIYILYENIGK